MKKIIRLFTIITLTFFFNACEKYSPGHGLEFYSNKSMNIWFTYFITGVDIVKNTDYAVYPLDSVKCYDQNGNKVDLEYNEGKDGRHYLSPFIFYIDSLDRNLAYTGITKSYNIEINPSIEDTLSYNFTLDFFTRFSGAPDDVYIHDFLLILNKADTVTKNSSLYLRKVVNL